MSASQQSIIVRQWHIIQFLLRSSGYVSTNDIKSYLDTKQIPAEIRTIQRDMATLATALPLECRKDDKPYSWRWQRLENVERVDLSLSEMLVFHQVDTQLRGVLPADLMERLEPLLSRSRLTLAMIGQDLDMHLNTDSTDTPSGQSIKKKGTQGFINPYTSPAGILYKWLRQMKSHLRRTQTDKITPRILFEQLPHWRTLVSTEDLQNLETELLNIGLHPLSQEIHQTLKKSNNPTN
ncbi:hypothetical protein SAMN02745664_1122 [Moraxella cuniculi DSM 21768]|uniref:WYL domain-containing protein n=1 Tax=Moraxella cuniculi DSM 21768 TaxID=1122245 RepID=A0A1N7FCE8_9GAMM|nr:hypothetical protein [Moraxella cuniculi]OOS07138.1 hypothetical protein B0189_04120 [Moraxella cuniculi]SIR97970.1 hypothetical protein SAMN02745664_1122 [Moraxella cuniculi DSM 21768]